MLHSFRRRGTRSILNHALSGLGGVILLLLAGSTALGKIPPFVGVDGSAQSSLEVAHSDARVLSPEAQAWVENTLDQLNLRQRVAQLVVPWIPGGEIDTSSAQFRSVRQWIEEDEVGGLIVSRGPVGEFAPMLNRLQALSSVPLLIVSDLETGPGMRLTGGTNLPPAMAFGAAGSEDLAFAAGRLTAQEARAAGIHMTLGPVLDVNSNAFNPIINTRSFGEDPDLVGRMASAWIAGAREGGLLSVGKHFPGHGATEVDSHMDLPTLTADREVLDSLDIAPFRHAINAGIDGILVGHIAVPAIDGPGAPPASLSQAVTGGLLREGLGFDGLVITDALNMGGVTNRYSVPEASIRALLAGADVLLQPPGTRNVIASIVAAVESGRIPRERIDEAARRVLEAKAAAGLHEDTRASGDPRPTEHTSVARRVAEASVTVARDRDALLPLPAETRSILHITYGSAGNSFSAGTFNRLLREAGRTVAEASASDRTGTNSLRSLASRAREVDLVIVSANLVPREYRGQLALQEGFSRFVEGLIDDGVPVVAISFGSPYLLDFFPSVSSYILSWSGSAESQRAAARVLLGSAPARGRLPVSLPPHHAIGEGLTRSPIN